MARVKIRFKYSYFEGVEREEVEGVEFGYKMDCVCQKMKFFS